MQEESCYSAAFTSSFVQLPDDSVQVSFVEKKNMENLLENNII